MDKDGKFVKIGERTVEVLSVDGDKITGKYSEVVKPGYEKENPNPDTFNFEYSPSTTQTFSYTDAQGVQKSGTIYANPTGKIYFQKGLEVVEKNGVVNRKSTMKTNYDGEFSRVFE
ncbi:hypothetical protein D3C84_1043170 [compost metagenome]